MDKLEKHILGEFINLSNYQEQVDVMMEIGAKYFTDKSAIKLLELFSKVLFEKKTQINFTTVYSQVRQIEELEIQDFIDIATNYKPEGNINLYIALLKERKYKGDITKIIDYALGKIGSAVTLDEINAYKDEMMMEVNRIGFEDRSEFIEPFEYINKIENNLEKGSSIEGYEWGINYLDATTSGIVTPRLYVLGGLKKTGKSRFVINTMLNLYKQKIPSVFLSLEMPAYEVTKLLISRYAYIPEQHLRGMGIITKEEKSLFKQAKDTIDWAFLNVECASRLNLGQVISRIRRYSKLFNKPVVFIDYLQRIEHDRNRQAQELEKISVAIADATREFNVPIVLLSQLSNLAERDGVSIGALKGSGGIGESADTIILLENLYRKQKLDENKNKMDIYVEQRYGDSAKFTVYTDLATCNFADLPENGRDWGGNP